MDILAVIVARSPLISHRRTPVRRSHVIAELIWPVVVVISIEVPDQPKITGLG